MKRTMFWALAACLCLVPLAVFAEAETVAEPEFFSWASLLTVSGATAVVTLFGLYNKCWGQVMSLTPLL